MTTERPILFSAPMVRAILAGTKTQTRRVVKPEPAASVSSIYRPFVAEPNNWQGYAENVGFMRWYGRCPYGQPGDRLWVRETWQAFERGWDVYDGIPKSRPANCCLLYAADDVDGDLGWRPSIHMPRWASRITLEVAGVRVERLQDISESDALAEGVGEFLSGENTARSAYADLWESINGDGSWEENPWVWVVEFKRAV